jgi:hypothetical protein
MAAVSHFLDEVVLTGSSAEGPVQAWDVRTGMQLKAYKCVRVHVWCILILHFFFSSSTHSARLFVASEVRLETSSHADALFPTFLRQDDGVRPRGAVPAGRGLPRWGERIGFDER